MAGIDALMEIDSVMSAPESESAAAMKRDEEEYETEIRRQRDELHELSAERERLLMMQQHLLKLQESLAAATDVAAQSTGGVQESTVQSPGGATGRSNLPADGTCASSSVRSAAAGHQKPSPRGNS